MESAFGFGRNASVTLGVRNVEGRLARPDRPYRESSTYRLDETWNDPVWSANLPYFFRSNVVQT